MSTITIPKTLAKNDDLVVLPRKEYEALVHAKNGAEKRAGSDIVVKRTMRVPKKYEKFYDEVDRELTEALREHYDGKSYGPFETAEEAIRFLRRNR